MRRRRPNPWIAIPALALGVLAGVLGWVVTDVSCRQDGAGCSGWAALVSIVSFLGVMVGVTLVLVLVYRSLAEWNEREGRSGPAEHE